MVPVQVRLPVDPSMLQPVELEPPARLMPPTPTTPPILRVVATVLKRFWVVALPTMVPAWRLMLPVPAVMLTAEALALEPILTVLAPLPGVPLAMLTVLAPVVVVLPAGCLNLVVTSSPYA